jgi:hypothetical protein
MVIVHRWPGRNNPRVEEENASVVEQNDPPTVLRELCGAINAQTVEHIKFVLGIYFFSDYSRAVLVRSLGLDGKGIRTNKDIAEELRISPGWVGVLRKRALAKFRRALMTEYPIH